MILIFFNLLANATFSLIASLLVVGFFLWFFRVQTGPWKVFLLSLPFVKILYDVVNGVPANSVLLTAIDPFVLPPKHQTLLIGAGFDEWRPVVRTVLSVRDLNGKEFASSIGDYLTIWINRTYGSDLLMLIIALVLAVSVCFLLFRITQAFKFEMKRRQDALQATEVGQRSVPLRMTDIYVSKAFSGTPFTGGVLKPYICIPSDAYSKLTPDELEAVIQHELGHIYHFDLVITICVQLLGDLFWFVPGYRSLAKKIDSLREIIADRWAVNNGTEPALLASALLKLKEIPESSGSFVHYSAFFRRKSLLKERVGRLLGSVEEPPSRFGWNFKAVRVLASFWIFLTVLSATFIGNHASAQLNNPSWFHHLLNLLGVQ